MENENAVPEPAEQVDYLAAAQEIANHRDTRIIQVNGKPLKVSRPDTFKLLKLFKENEHLAEDGMDDFESVTATIKLVQLCLPEGLDEETVSAIMDNAGYFFDEECALRDTVEGFVNSINFRKAGEQPEADPDFSQPGQQDTATVTG